MTRAPVWVLLLNVVLGQTAPDIPQLVTAAGVSLNTFVQGSGVVNAGPNQNYMDFSFTRTLNWGDKIGFYIFDNTKTAADKSAANEYDCGNTVSKLQSPLLSIDPSTEFNTTVALPYHNVSASPSRTPSFGGLAQGRYKLCYCKKPAVSSKNPQGECRPADYKWAAGVFFFYDAPELRQRRSVNVEKNFNRFTFKIKKLSGSNQRVVIPDADSSFQTGFDKTRGCGRVNQFSGTQPAFSHGATTDDTSQKTPLTLVHSAYTYDEVAYHMPVQAATAPTKEGFYSVCLCDSDNIGTSACTTGCETRTCSSPEVAPVEIATLFVHDLTFYSLGTKVVATSAERGVTSLTFDYSKPSTVFANSRFFWFARSSVQCGSGAHAAASAHVTLRQQWQSTRQVLSVDFSGAAVGSVLDPFRLCILQADGSVLDVDNVVVVVSDVVVTFGGLADKISDNNQVGLKPVQATRITGSVYQTGTPSKDNGVWFSENFVTLSLAWNTSLTAYSEVYAVLSTFPCSANVLAARSKSHVLAQGVSTSSVVLDLGNTLWNVTKFDTPNTATTSNFVAPAPSSQNANNTLFSDYSLCATCSGCSGFGYSMGRRFRVLAALHVYQDVGFEKPYRFNANQQLVVIASGVVPSPSPSPLFWATDRLYFADSCCPCFDWTAVGYNTNSSAPVYGNQTVYASKTATSPASLLNAFQYSFDFSSIPAEKADGRLFKLCVQRVGETQILEFPGCAVSIIRATQSPTLLGSQSSTVDSRTYSTNPVSQTADGAVATYVVNSVVTDNANNVVRWSFTGGFVDSADRLSISAVGDGATVSTECQAHAYSYTTFLASAGGPTSLSPATSGAFGGMLPGQYALCYCNVKVVGAPITACRTSRDFAQFAGYVYFDGSYAGPDYVRSFAAHYLRDTNINLKLVTGSALDRMMLVASTSSCGVGYSVDSTLVTAGMANPTVTETKAPTTTPNAPSRFPTRAPSTKTPTASPTRLPTKAPTKSPTKAPTSPTASPTKAPTTAAPTTAAPTTAAPTTAAPTAAVGRRRLLVTSSPSTKAPTAAPSTLAPTTKAPTKPTAQPTKNPTEAPTKFPTTPAPTTKSPTNTLKYTSSPTESGETDPYVTMKLIAPRQFTLVGKFKICYCWHNRYSGVGATTTYTSSTASFSFPTKAPTTAAPTAVGRRRLRASTSFTFDERRNGTNATTCLNDVYQSQRRFGVEVGTLLVHDLYLVSTFGSGSGWTTTARMAVRAETGQQVWFQAAQSAAGLASNPSAWWAKANAACGSAGVGGVSTPAISGFGNGLTQFAATFDFSNGFSRSCSAATRRQFDFSSAAESLFYRLCVSALGVSSDYSNLLVTVTDIVLLGEYRNPVVTAAGGVTIKFAESCGFLWSERYWRATNYFRFVASDRSCEYQTDSPLSTSTDYTYETLAPYAPYNGYVMYEASLITYFLDDHDYPSTVKFGAAPRRRVAFRMCMYIQSNAAAITAPATKYDWVDFPDVALYPVSEYVKLSTKSDKYDSAAVTDCPLGWLGCKCDTASNCFGLRMLGENGDKQNQYRDLDIVESGIFAQCKSSVCVAPTRALFGTRETYNNNVTCTQYKPCANPGPTTSSSTTQMFIKFNTDLNANDQITFVRSDYACSTTSGTSGFNTNLQSETFISVAAAALDTGGTFYRLCVKVAAGAQSSWLDYYSTGFTRYSTTTSSPTRRTLKPTSWYNKGNTITFSPTLANPEFKTKLDNYPVAQDPLAPAVFNQLHITTENTNNPVYYTQWTNYTVQKILAQDTLRVYRMVQNRPSSLLGTGKGKVADDAVCTPNWVRNQVLETNDLVMEVRVNKDGVDTAATSGAVATVQFPALPKGYYTLCFCRKTPSNKCQMTSAGMVYSSASRMVSVTGSGVQGASFRVTPLLDYEVTSDLFNTTRNQYITAQHFCLSADTNGLGCANCTRDSNKPTHTFNQEFSIALSPGNTFPLVITNVWNHLGASQRVYNLCFQDPMLRQFHTSWNGSALLSSRYDLNDTWYQDSWNYAKIGTVYLSDLTFQWEQNGGFTPGRTSYSVAVGNNLMAKLHYSSSAEVVQQNDVFWFTRADADCSTETSVAGASTVSQPVPATSFTAFLYFNGVSAGRFYRMCLRPANSPGVYRDFGVEFGAWVTDVVPSATTFHFFESFHLSLASTLSLAKGEEFFLLHVDVQLCSDYSTLQAGWVSPNIGVFNYSTFHNMGKMPQVAFDSSSGNVMNVPLGYAGYRLCVKRTENGETSYRDYAGLTFSPQGSNHVVQTQVARTRSKVRILSGLSRDTSSAANLDTLKGSFTVQATDNVWFQRSDSKCAKQFWNTATNSASTQLSSGTALTSSMVTVASSHYDQLSGQYLEIEFDFTSTEVTTLPFRLCVERLSWTHNRKGDNIAPAQNIVQDYPNIKLTVSSAVTSTTSSPTSFVSLQSKPTSAPGTVPGSNQVATVYAKSQTNQFRWTFSGTVDPLKDKLALVAYSVSLFLCNGQTGFADPWLLLPASNATGAVGGPATFTPVFASVPPGRYFICYCQAATSITGDCSNELGWRQTVGFLYSFAVTPSDLSVSKLASAPSALTVWFDQTVDVSMRFMFVDNAGTCGTSAASSGVPMVTFNQPAGEAEATGTTLQSGLTLSASYSSSTVGVYQVCLCPSFCGSDVKFFGGKIADLLVHDIKLNGQSSAVTLQKLTATSANLTVSQALFAAGSDTVWFARNDCGDGNHAPTQNLTRVQPVPASGGNLLIDYSLVVPSMALHKMCVQNATSKKVYALSSLGFIVTDVNLTVTSPAISSSSSIGVSYGTGLEILVSAPANRVLFFRDLEQTCDSACSTTLQTCSVVADQYTTGSAQVATSFHVSNSPSVFDLSRLAPLRAYRLCVLLDSVANNPKAFIDFTDIRIYPVASDSDFYVASGAALHRDAYDIYLTTPANGYGTPRATDTLYFRRFDSPCLARAPVAADANTSSAFAPQGLVASKVNFAAVSMTAAVFRLCLQTSAGLVLDYNTKKLYLTTVAVSTRFCRPAPTPCKVSIAVTSPEGLFGATGFLGSSAVQVWFQRETSSARACSPTAPQSSNSDSSRSSTYSATGTTDIDFSLVSSSVSAPLKLCVRNSNLNVVADFPTVSLLALDVALAPASSVNSKPATEFVTAGLSPVRIVASANSVPSGSDTWFQTSSLACVKPTVATASSTMVVTTNQTLVSPTDLVYDFSKVPTANQQHLFRLCYTVNNAVVDANTVQVTVLEYTVSPAYVGAGTLESVFVDPALAVGINFFTFCRADTQCPTLGQLQTFSTVNCSSRGVSFTPSAISQLDFSQVRSDGKVLKLCGVRANHAAPYDVADLFPKGVFQGSLAVDRNAVLKTSTSTNLQITWSQTLANATGGVSFGDVVWFQDRSAPCTSTSQQDSTRASNTADVKASPFSAVFDFSKITSAVVLKLCSKVGGVVKDFTETSLSLMEVSLGATSVKAAAAQDFTVTYTSSPALGAAVTAFFSTDMKCAATPGTSTATRAVASVSGATHSFDFSAAAASASSWYLCLKGNATLAVDFASLVVADVGDLGKTSVSNTAGQVLKLASSVSILTNDTVWFSSAGCSSTTSKSSSVKFSGNSDYTFDFSSVTASLTTKYAMCVSRTPAAGGQATSVFQYSSSSVIVVPSASLGGPYMVGNRALNLSALSSFLGTSTVAFVVGTSSCAGAVYVASSTTVYNFPVAGQYRMCVQTSDGKITDVSSVTVVLQDCAQLCPSTRAVNAGCDANTGKCTQCTPHFSGDQCQKCAAGYTGSNCDVCDTVNNYQCSVSSSSTAGYCALDQTCAVCQCNGHFDPSAASRCPGNVCVCSVGYSGNACENCATGYYKVITNGTSTFTCASCAAKCFNHAASCTDTACQCSDNYDPVSNCKFCRPGFIQNVTSGVCVQTSSPTASPTPKPTMKPTTSPTSAPTADPCASLADAKESWATNCPSWAKDNYCTDATKNFTQFMATNCAKTCCELKRTAPAPAPTAASSCSSAADAGQYAASCPGWKGYCNDPAHYSFMSTSCAKTCCEAQASLNGWCSSLTDSSAFAASCPGWKSAGYCTDPVHNAFMTLNCAATCKADKQEFAASCGYWALKGYCGDASYSAFMQQSCVGSCCQLGRPTAYSKATDASGSCDSWAGQGYCSNSAYTQYMYSTCPRTCGDLLCLANPSTRKNDASVSASCPGWSDYCTNTNYTWYMAKNCPATCCRD